MPCIRRETHFNVWDGTTNSADGRCPTENVTHSSRVADDLHFRLKIELSTDASIRLRIP